MIDVPMKQVFKNSSHHDVTVRVFILGEPSMHKVMSPGDILSIPDIPGDYLIELVAWLTWWLPPPALYLPLLLSSDTGGCEWKISRVRIAVPVSQVKKATIRGVERRGRQTRMGEEKKKLKEFKKLLDRSSLGSPEAKKMRKIGKKAIKEVNRRKKGSE
jgi:hypothetical protein